MNELSLLNDFVIERFDLNPLVNTITIVPTIDIDANKENIYPLVNIDMVNTDIQTDAILVNYTITIVQQRELKSQKIDSKLLNDSNYLDNMNECHTIASKFINYLTWKNNDLVIEIQSQSDLKPLKNWGQAGLDGFRFDIELSIHNKGKAI